jgi:catechol 2,3-dioxygenase-like lactoylglutathione lyase family enzyme
VPARSETPASVPESISAVTLMVSDMARAVAFYRSLGFVLRYGGEDAPFTSFTVGRGFLNLQRADGPPQAKATPPRSTGWGRVILYVSDVDAMYDHALSLKLRPEAPPRNAPWGERFFHLRDPDGHELSFARPLRNLEA